MTLMHVFDPPMCCATGEIAQVAGRHLASAATEETLKLINKLVPIMARSLVFPAGIPTITQVV